MTGVSVLADRHKRSEGTCQPTVQVRILPLPRSWRSHQPIGGLLPPPPRPTHTNTQEAQNNNPSLSHLPQLLPFSLPSTDHHKCGESTVHLSHPDPPSFAVPALPTKPKGGLLSAPILATHTLSDGLNLSRPRLHSHVSRMFPPFYARRRSQVQCKPPQTCSYPNHPSPAALALPRHPMAGLLATLTSG